MEDSIRFCDAVRHLYIPSLNLVTNSKGLALGLRQWLSLSDNFVPTGYVKDDLLELTLYDNKEVLIALARDIDRLSCAAVETIMNIDESILNKKFLAWSIIRYYYAAFFSAHSMLKLLGMGLTQIDEKIIQHMKRRCNVLGITEPRLSSGIYCTKIDISHKTLTLYKIRRYDDSHRGLWKRFADFLEVISGISIQTNNYDSNCIRKRNVGESHPQSIYTYLSASDADSVISRIDDLRSMLNQRGDNNWFSSIRSLVNYNHEYGIWYPYRQYDRTYDNINAMKGVCFSNFLDSCFEATSSKELIKFVKYVQMINSMNIDILHDLCDRHPENKSYFKNGTLSYIKHYSSIVV